MSEFGERMGRLRERYLIRLALDLEHLDALLVGDPTPGNLVSLQQIAHKLAGISGSLGFPEISTHAKALDRDWSTTQAETETIGALVDNLKAAAREYLSRTT